MANSDKVAIITGAAGGIGADVGRRMAAEGYKVLLTDINEAGAKTAAEIKGASFLVQDVATEDGWKTAVDHAVKTHGGLDAIVNCAGYLKSRIEMLDTTLELWRQHFAVNTDSAFLACKYGVPAMKPRGGGSIVNFSSGLAEKLSPLAPAYCASKAAVITTTKLAALAGAPHKVRVNCLLPGAVETPMFWRNLQPGQTREDLMARIAAGHPIGRVGSTDDMAELVLFLCSDKAGFITGAAITIDGGQTL